MRTSNSMIFHAFNRITVFIGIQLFGNLTCSAYFLSKDSRCGEEEDFEEEELEDDSEEDDAGFIDDTATRTESVSSHKLFRGAW